MPNVLQNNFVRNRLSPLVFIVFVGFVLAGCQERAPLTERVETAEMRNVEPSQKGENDVLRQGEALYNRMCASCHGARGSGRGTRSGPSLQRSEFTYGRTYEAVKASIRDGRLEGGMPFFHHALSEDELDAVTQYVLSLGQ